jgi:hypothetical protein
MKFPILVALSSVAAFLGAGGYTVLPEFVTTPIKHSLTPPTQRGTACNIKGNVSITSGERIYHVPGQHYYEATIISPQYGERWFCSEQEAHAAGWRRAGY